MHHRTRCRRTEIGLQVRRMVVHQRAHALAALHSQPLQALRKPSRTLVEIAVRVSLDIAVPAPPRDLHSRKQPPRTLQDASQRQLERHHRAPHAASSSVVLLGPRILPRICRCPIYDPILRSPDVFQSPPAVTSVMAPRLQKRYGHGCLRPSLRERRSPMATTTASPAIVKNILFATDFSPASEAVLPYARALAHTYGAQLVITHVVAPGVVAVEPPVVINMAELAQDQMEQLQTSDQLEGIAQKEIIVEGPIWESLNRVIEEQEIDLVVVGTHGRTGVG